MINLKNIFILIAFSGLNIIAGKGSGSKTPATQEIIKFCNLDYRLQRRIKACGYSFSDYNTFLLKKTSGDKVTYFTDEGEPIIIEEDKEDISKSKIRITKYEEMCKEFDFVKLGNLYFKNKRQAEFNKLQQDDFKTIVIPEGAAMRDPFAGFFKKPK